MGFAASSFAVVVFFPGPNSTNCSRCKVSCCAVQFYGYLSQQQNMMQDYIRTSTYQRAMLENAIDFQDKVKILRPFFILARLCYNHFIDAARF